MVRFDSAMIVLLVSSSPCVIASSLDRLAFTIKHVLKEFSTYIFKMFVGICLHITTIFGLHNSRWLRLIKIHIWHKDLVSVNNGQEIWMLYWKYWLSIYNHIVTKKRLITSFYFSQEMMSKRNAFRKKDDASFMFYCTQQQHERRGWLNAPCIINKRKVGLNEIFTWWKRFIHVRHA